MQIAQRPRSTIAVGEAVAVVRDRAPGKVEGSAIPVEDRLHASRVKVDRRVVDRGGERGHHGGRVVFEERHHMVECRARDFRLITLQVDDDAGCVELGGDFGHAVGAGRMVSAGHHDLTTKGFHGLGDARVVGRDDYPFQHAARRAASTTCWIKGLPVSDSRGLPGSRVEAKRAGITATISMFIKNISR